MRNVNSSKSNLHGIPINHHRRCRISLQPDEISRHSRPVARGARENWFRKTPESVRYWDICAPVSELSRNPDCDSGCSSHGASLRGVGFGANDPPRSVRELVVRCLCQPCGAAANWRSSEWTRCSIIGSSARCSIIGRTVSRDCRLPSLTGTHTEPGIPMTRLRSHWLWVCGIAQTAASCPRRENQGRAPCALSFGQTLEHA